MERSVDADSTRELRLRCTVQALFIFFLFLIVFTVLNIFVAIIDFNYGQVHLVTALQSAPCKTRTH